MSNERELLHDLRAYLDDLSIQELSILRHCTTKQLRQSKLLPKFAKKLSLNKIKDAIDECWSQY